MADEITLQFAVPGQPDALRQFWRSEPPGFIHDHDYRLKDESYDSLVYEREGGTKVGRLLNFGIGKDVYKLSVNFRSDGRGTSITVTGKAPERARAQIAEYAAACGGGHDPRMTRFLRARGYIQ